MRCAVVEVERLQHLAQRDRALRHADRLVGALLEQRVVAGAHARARCPGACSDVDERPRQRRVEVRLRAHVQHDHVARDARRRARRLGRSANERVDCVEEVAARRAATLRARRRISATIASIACIARRSRALARSRRSRRPAPGARTTSALSRRSKQRDQAVEVRARSRPRCRPTTRARGGGRGGACSANTSKRPARRRARRSRGATASSRCAR